LLDKVPAYTVVNLNVDFVPTTTHFRLSLTATNVGNVAGSPRATPTRSAPS
jgi:hypothetical protein